MASQHPRTAVNEVSDSIRRKILEGSFKGLEYLREAAVAKELDVSRTPVREAFRELVSEGWLEAIPHRGCRVVPWDENDARDMFEIRVVLEPMAVAGACGRVDEEAMGELRDYCSRMEALTERVDEDTEARDELARLNLEFHQRLHESSGNRRLVALLHNLVRGSLVRRNYAHYDIEHLQRSMRHHSEILDAIEAGDSQWAEHLMRTHLLAARSLHVGATAPSSQS